jgi:hypothetical protein
VLVGATLRLRLARRRGLSCCGCDVAATTAGAVGLLNLACVSKPSSDAVERRVRVCREQCQHAEQRASTAQGPRTEEDLGRHGLRRIVVCKHQARRFRR